MKYDVYIVGQDEKYYEFESDWVYEVNNRLFHEENDVLYSLVIARITHTLENNRDIHRLNCHKSVYEKK